MLPSLLTSDLLGKLGGKRGCVLWRGLLTISYIDEIYKKKKIIDINLVLESPS